MGSFPTWFVACHFVLRERSVSMCMKGGKWQFPQRVRNEAKKRNIFLVSTRSFLAMAWHQLYQLYPYRPVTSCGWDIWWQSLALWSRPILVDYIALVFRARPLALQSPSSRNFSGAVMSKLCRSFMKQVTARQRNNSSSPSPMLLSQHVSVIRPSSRDIHAWELWPLQNVTV
jgi:hypothetical protein